MADDQTDQPEPAAEVETLRAEVAALRAELAEARRAAQYDSGTIVALRAMLHEARAASARPSGLDGRRLSVVHRPGNA